MLHNEHLRKADELYECRHDNNGNVIHIYIKDGEAIVFPTLDCLVRRLYFGEEVERFYVNEDILEELYDRDEYDYYELKNIVLTEINLD